jgi:hypothetical protein
MSCPVHNFLIHEHILEILGRNVNKNETMCHAQKKTIAYKVKIKVRGQSLTYSVTGYILRQVHNFFLDQGILKLFSTGVYKNKMMCPAQKTVAYLQDQGHS